jgi:hypothetical protein
MKRYALMLWWLPLWGIACLVLAIVQPPNHPWRGLTLSQFSVGNTSLHHQLNAVLWVCIICELVVVAYAFVKGVL